MSIFDLFLIALGLSMDAFAVSVCKGLSVQSMRPRHALVCGVWFGVFQALMPLCGYLLGEMERGRWRRILFAPTGALLSPTSTCQGESIPSICHAVVIESV